MKKVNRTIRTRRSIRLKTLHEDKTAGILGGEPVRASQVAWRSPARLLAVYPEKTPETPILIYRSNVRTTDSKDSEGGG